jgi:hypothetical protein
VPQKKQLKFPGWQKYFANGIPRSAHQQSFTQRCKGILPVK